MTLADPRSSFEFANAPGSPVLPDTSQAGLLIGVGDALPNTLLPYSSGANVRAAFAEARITEIAEAHFALDPARRPIAVIGTEASTPGVLYLNTTGVVGSSVATADGVVTPLGDWPGVRVDVVTGGTIGTPGILLDLSLDYGLTKTRVALNAATFVEFEGKGIKINFAAGTLGAGGYITGSTDPPRWSIPALQAAMLAARQTAARFSLVCIAEHLVPSDGATISAFLDELAAGIPRRPVHLIGSKRPQYRSTSATTITATFADTNPDTLSRAAGSFITDGFKPGMRVTISGALTSGNNGVKVRVASVSALALTFTSNITLTAEVATASVIVTGQETDDDYTYNLAAEWSGFEDSRVTLTVGRLRATRPYDSAQTDQLLNGYLFARCVAEPIQIEPGQRAATPQGGGRVAGKLNGRVYEGLTRVLPDSASLAALVTAPSRAVAVQTEADGRPGVYFVEARTMFASGDQIKYLRMARLANEAKSIILAIQIDSILSGLASNPSDPNRLSSKAEAALTDAGANALRKRFSGIISNADTIDDPEGPLYSIDPASDLSTGTILANIFIRTFFYPNGFKTTLTIKAPGA